MSESKKSKKIRKGKTSISPDKKYKNNKKDKSSNNVITNPNNSTFYFRQKSVFLTYPHVEKYNIEKKELGEYLYDTFKCEITVVCLEHHKDGNPHLHAWLEWETPFYTRNPHIFDYKNAHPNIGQMLDKYKNKRSNALNYMLKEDENLFSKGIDIENWKYTCKNKTKYICEDLIKEKINLKDLVEKSPNLLYNYNKLKTNLASFKLDKSENKNIFKTSNNLWIWGMPGSGKTYYATTTYPNHYIKLQNKWWDGYNGEEVVILDDLNDKSMGYYIKIWADNYKCKGEIKNGTIPLEFKMFIVTSNYMPRAIFKEDPILQLAIARRFKFITIRGTYPSYEPMDLPNPCEANFI